MADITGTSGDDTLVGTPDDDNFDGGAGADTMSGLDGDDDYIVDNAGDQAIEAEDEGYDSLFSSVSYTIQPGTRVEALWATVAGLTLTGNEFDNVLFGLSGVETLNGGDGNDTLYGLGGNDTLNGGAGNDHLDGGTGVDDMAGGAGDDVYIVESQTDDVIEAADQGYDVVQVYSHYTLDFGQHIELIQVMVGGVPRVFGNNLAQEIWGNTGDDDLRGGGGADAIFGFGGRDTLTGADGTQYLDGGAGADFMSGAGGDDIYIVDDVDDAILNETSTGGYDIAYTSVSYTLNASNLEVLAAMASGLVLTAALPGTDLWGTDGTDTLIGRDGNDSFSGGGGDDTMTGGAGNDIFYGGAGADTMTGGTGRDTYYVDDPGDRAIEDHLTSSSDEVNDIVWTSIDFALEMGGGVDILAAATGGLVLVGNERGNALWGHDGGNDRLEGGDGSDHLFGFGGNDFLDGGTGSDTMFGGLGDDLYLFDNFHDSCDEAGGGGYDVVLTFLSKTFTAATTGVGRTIGIEVVWAALPNLMLTASGVTLEFWGSTGTDFFVGDTGNDVMSGLDGDDYLLGGGGSDVMFGGLGNDTYRVDQSGDQVYEQAGQGARDVVEATGSHTLLAGSEVEIVWARAADLTLVGNELAQDFWGHDGGRDVMSGAGGDDSLSGFAGDDALDGGLGNDVLIGGAGIDSYRFTTTLGAGNVDVVAGFAVGQDKIELSDTIFGLPEGPLAVGAFRTGTTALDADDRILYDPSTGQLMFDSDGVGGAAAVLFARLDAGLNLSAGDFAVI